MLNSFLKTEYGRFWIAGGINTVFGFSSFPLLYFFLESQISYFILLGISYSLNILFSFTMHRNVTFRSQGNIRHELSKYILLHLILFVFNFIILFLLSFKLENNPLVSQIVISVVFFFVSFFWHKLITFPKKWANK
jgi:putative flippase GtrA